MTKREGCAILEKKGVARMLTVKRFYELSQDELFAIYKARCDIFVVEQNCPYPEVDEFDKVAYHITYSEGGALLAYCRLLPERSRFQAASVGRVLATVRRRGYASLVVAEAIRVARDILKVDTLVLDAQTYVIEFYEKLGFAVTSGEFLEDGIPHVQMTWKRGDQYGK